MCRVLKVCDVTRPALMNPRQTISASRRDRFLKRVFMGRAEETRAGPAKIQADTHLEGFPFARRQARCQPQTASCKPEKQDLFRIFTYEDRKQDNTHRRQIADQREAT